MAGRQWHNLLVGPVCMLLLLLLSAACAPDENRAPPTATYTSLPPTATATVSPSPSPTPPELSVTMATLQAELTAEPCSSDDVIAYSEMVLPLVERHLSAANQAHDLQPWHDGQVEFYQGYGEAVERLRELEGVVPPPCAEKTHLKYTSAFRLLVDVWDHLGEAEFDIAQRKLLSSFDEVSQATALLTQLQSNTNRRP